MIKNACLLSKPRLIAHGPGLVFGGGSHFLVRRVHNSKDSSLPQTSAVEPSGKELLQSYQQLSPSGKWSRSSLPGRPIRGYTPRLETEDTKDNDIGFRRPLSRHTPALKIPVRLAKPETSGSSRPRSISPKVSRSESVEERRDRELKEMKAPREGMNDGILGEIHARRAKIGNRRHTPMPEPARDANDLTEKMTKWLRVSRKDSSLSGYLIACVQYFAGHPAEFRTTESWCIMITVALRVGDYNTTSELFGLMKAEGVSRSSLTDAVELRYIILTKGWEAGWTYARSLTPSDAAGGPPTALPYHLWMKLAAPARRLTDSDSKARDRQDISDPQAVLLLVEALPDLPEGTDVEKVQYAITLAKTLVQITATNTAMDFIRRYLHNLPASLDETMIERCVNLINVAAYERSYFSSQAVRFFYKHCRMVDELLSIHSLLRPTTNTLLLLLANLEEADDPADRAVKLVARYQKLSGDDIVDERVQHRLAKLVHRSVERSQLLRKATTTLPQPQQERHWKRTEPGLKLDGQNGDDEVALAKANPGR